MPRPLPQNPNPAPNQTGANRLRRGIDSAGILLSALCAVHCLAGAALVLVVGLGGTVLASGLPSLLGTRLADPRIHEYGLMLALAVGAVGLGAGFARHRRRDILAMGVSGLALMAAGLTVSHGLGEAGLTVAGVTLLASAHIRNLRHQH